MVLNLNIPIRTRPKRIKHYASQIELDDYWREIKGFPHYRINNKLITMNLNAYDNVKEELDKHKTWYSPKFKRLYSREIKFRMFYKFMKRWNETIKRDDYFLAVSMNNVDGRFSITNKDNYSRLKFSIPKEVIEDSILNTMTVDANVEVKLVDAQLDGEVYQLNI